MNYRDAEPLDCDWILTCRNDPETRNQSFNSKEISLEEHTLWFNRSLTMTNRKIIIAEYEFTRIGVVRLDYEDVETIEISVFLEPEQRGKGYGQIILKGINEYAVEWLPSLKQIVALVKQTNLASIRAFTKLGYIQQHVSVDNIVTFKLTL